MADTQVCDGNDDKGSSPDRLGYTPMGRVPGDAGKCMANGIYTDVQSATTISHMSSGNGDISDTLLKDKAGMQSSTISSSGVLQVSPLNSLSMNSKRLATERKIPLLGCLCLRQRQPTLLRKIIVTTPRLHRKRQWCYSY